MSLLARVRLVEPPRGSACTLAWRSRPLGWLGGINTRNHRGLRLRAAQLPACAALRPISEAHTSPVQKRGRPVRLSDAYQQPCRRPLRRGDIGTRRGRTTADCARRSLTAALSMLLLGLLWRCAAALRAPSARTHRLPRGVGRGATTVEAGVEVLDAYCAQDRCARQAQMCYVLDRCGSR